jgi:hypothetical protein
MKRDMASADIVIVKNLILNNSFLFLIIITARKYLKEQYNAHSSAETNNNLQRTQWMIYRLSENTFLFIMGMSKHDLIASATNELGVSSSKLHFKI